MGRFWTIGASSGGCVGLIFRLRYSLGIAQARTLGSEPEPRGAERMINNVCYEGPCRKINRGSYLCLYLGSCMYDERLRQPRIA